jgi:hypothetical protein
MPVYRLQCSFGADSQFPRDRMVLTPHFDVKGPNAPNVDQLCEDLATALYAWALPASAREVRVTAYDAQGTPPVFPVGDAVRGLGQAPLSTAPRELALCLSFFSERNLPRNRGRLYLPFTFLSSGSPVLRPTSGHQTKAAALVPIFTGLGGIDVDWSIYSRTDDQARPVTDWWVDDEWDIIRSRGMRPTARQTGTTTEANAP